MVDKLDELQQEPRDPNLPESIKIKEEFWQKLADQLTRTKHMVEGWVEEDRQNAVK